MQDFERLNYKGRCRYGSAPFVLWSVGGTAPGVLMPVLGLELG